MRICIHVGNSVVLDATPEQIAARYKLIAKARQGNLTGQVESQQQAMSSWLKKIGYEGGSGKLPPIVAKMSKQSAQYTDGPVERRPCRECSMFRDGSCTAVVGTIAPRGHCRLWERA